MEAGRLGDLHAYVDDCLEPDERLAFEQRMAQDPALARRAALWRGQNSAIRAAFDGEGARAFPISLVRHQNETFGRSARSGAAGVRLSGEQLPRASLAAFAETGREIRSPAARILARNAFRLRLPWRLGLAVLSVCLALVWVPAASAVAGKRLGEAGVAAFRAFGRPKVELVELATSDTAEAQAWLTAQLARPLYLPATSPILKLIGARIAPYPGAPAAFLFYRSQDRLVGLLVQSLDAPGTMGPQLLAADGGTAAVWTWRGQGLALVGDLEPASLLKIATDFADLPADCRSAHARARLVRLLIAHLLHQRGQFRIRLIRQNDSQRRQQIPGGLVGPTGQTFAPQSQHPAAVRARSDRDFDLAAERRGPSPARPKSPRKA